MMAGSYALHLYCDNENISNKYKFDKKLGCSVDEFGHFYDEFPHEFVDEFGAHCRYRARKKGWILGKKQVLCPKCSGKAARI